MNKVPSLHFKARRRRRLFMAGILGTLLVGMGEACSKQPTRGATLRGLDKVTGKVYSVDVPVGSLVEFGNLKIIVHKCYKSDPEDFPESLAFLTIIKSPPDEEEQVIFEGYMFASSPAISCLEDPVYDVWIKECKDLPMRKPSSVV